MIATFLLLQTGGRLLLQGGSGRLVLGEVESASRAADWKVPAAVVTWAAGVRAADWKVPTYSGTWTPSEDAP